MMYRKTALIKAEQFLPSEGKIPAGVILDSLSAEWVLDTLEGRHTLRPGDYICTGSKGERWNVEQSIFEATYEPVEQSASCPVEEEEVERLKAKMRAIVAHATGGNCLEGDDLSLNDISVRITAFRNKLYEAGKEAGSTTRSVDVSSEAKFL